MLTFQIGLLLGNKLNCYQLSAIKDANLNANWNKILLLLNHIIKLGMGEYV